VSARHIRPRARHRVTLEDVEIGSRVFVNYNYDEPSERGYWYDAVVEKKRVTRTIKELYATVFIG
jgi:E3 ubiquitin-protein ligase UHRF1